MSALLPKLFIRDATFHARLNLWFSSTDSCSPASFFIIILSNSLSNPDVEVTSREWQRGHDKRSEASFVCTSLSHLPHLMQINLCFVLSNLSFISSITPFSMLRGLAENLVECSKIGFANCENSLTSFQCKLILFLLNILNISCVLLMSYLSWINSRTDSLLTGVFAYLSYIDRAILLS